MSAADTLLRLANTPAREFVAKDETGTRLLKYHHEACCTSRLLPASSAGATDDAARLHAIFDVALATGLGSLVLDYIAEVCSDPSLTSSEPLEAYLLDGECVGRWAAGALGQTRQQRRQGLERGLAAEDAAALRTAAARLQALIAVLEALAPASQQGAREEQPSVTEARLLLQCAQVLQWAAEAGLAGAAPAGRFASRQEWLLTVNRRRDARGLIGSWLGDLQAALQEHGAARSWQYPPDSLERCVESLFLSGAASPHALSAKRAAFCYWLLDAGHSGLLQSFREAFHVPAGQAAMWQAGFLTDEAALQPAGGAALQSAAAVLAETATDVPLKLIQALAELGAPQAALRLLRARDAGAGGADPSAALDECLAAVGVLLACGMVTEAYLQVRRHCGRLPPEQLRGDTEALIGCLAGWAAAAGQLGAVMRLPLLGLEEEVLLAWLEEQAAEGTPLADCLPLYFLQRQRLPEALAAFARLPRLPGGGEAAARRHALQQALEAAGQLLPPAQAALVLHSPQAAPGLSLAPASNGGTGPLGAAPQGSALHAHGSLSQPPPLVGPLAAGCGPSDAAEAAQEPMVAAAAPPAASLAAPAPPQQQQQTQQQEGGREGSGGFAGMRGLTAAAAAAPAAHDWDALMGLSSGGNGGRKQRRRRQNLE